MDKQTFLKKLEEALSVLNEEELKDIIGEYEQHIDMKVKNGLTEEEAIADFGDEKELIAELLEAYHVRADYASAGASGAAGGRKGKAQSGPQEKETASLLQQFQEKGAHLRKAAAEKGSAWKERISGWSDGLRREKPEAGAGEAAGEAAGTEAGTERRNGRSFLRQVMDRAAGCVRGLWRLTAALAAGLWHLAGRAVTEGIRFLRWGLRNARTLLLAGIRICGKAFWVCWMAFWGGMGLFALFGLGVLAVLLIQAYPLAGVTVGSVGLNLCLFPAAGLGVTFLYQKMGQKAKVRGVLLVLILAGVLVGGIGTGAAIAEYSSMTYLGVRILGEDQMVTEELDFAFDPELGKVEVLPVWYGGGEHAALRTDASVPEHTIRYQVTYNPRQVQPKVTLQEAETGLEGEAADQIQGTLLLERWYQDDSELWWSQKDVILQDLKNRQFASYRAPGITEVVILVNPADRQQIVYQE